MDKLFLFRGGVCCRVRLIITDLGRRDLISSDFFACLGLWLSRDCRRLHGNNDLSRLTKIFDLIQNRKITDMNGTPHFQGRNIHFYVFRKLRRAAADFHFE